MLQSNLIDYAAIAMAESRNSGIFDQDYLAGITVLGFNELVENGFITLSKTSWRIHSGTRCLPCATISNGFPIGT